MGRAAQGVKLINLKDNDIIASVARVINSDDSESGSENINLENNENIDSENNGTDE